MAFRNQNGLYPVLDSISCAGGLWAHSFTYGPAASDTLGNGSRCYTDVDGHQRLYIRARIAFDFNCRIPSSHTRLHLCANRSIDFSHVPIHLHTDRRIASNHLLDPHDPARTHVHANRRIDRDRLRPTDSDSHSHPGC